MQELLREIGLSEGEIKVYQALLNVGPSSLNIIHESVGIERRNIYDIINKLIERGLVSYITENKRRVFQVTHPNKLVGYLDEKEQKVIQVKEKIKDEMPQLLKKFQILRPPINAEIFRGIEGVKAVWEEVLEHKESYWIGSGNYIPKNYPHFYAIWNRKRVEKKAKRFHLYRAEIRGHVIEHKLEQHRFLPQAFSQNPVVVCAYGNKVAQMMLGKDLYVFVIESKEVAENHRKYFDYLWKNVAKP